MIMPIPRHLPADSIVVRWLRVDAIGDADWPSLTRLLDAHEQVRAERFVFAHDREAYIAAHALARFLLSSFAALAPPAWRFAPGQYGKPEIIDHPAAAWLRFNLSHTRGLAGVAVTAARDAGVDVEAVVDGRIGIDFAERIFAPDEVAYLRRQPASAQTEAAMTIWTLKEAFIKATGQGLSCPLKAFTVVPAELSIRFSGQLDDDPACWLLHTQKVAPRHVLAVAARRRPGERVRIDAREASLSELLG
jgi:4'-phosphopantetheinyl transferase